MNYVETLNYFVPQESISAFINAENLVWEPWLRQQEGLLEKEIWIDTDQPIVTCVITWVDQASCMGCNPEEVASLKQQFQDAMSGSVYGFLDSDGYFAQTTIDIEEETEDDTESTSLSDAMEEDPMVDMEDMDSDIMPMPMN